MRGLLIALVALGVATLIGCGSPTTEFGKSLIVRTDYWEDLIHTDEVIILFIVPNAELAVWPLKAGEALKGIAEGEYDHCWKDEAEWRFEMVPIMVCPQPGYTREDFIGTIFRLE